MAGIQDIMAPVLGLVTPASAIIVWFLFHRAFNSPKIKIPAEERGKFSMYLLAGLLGWLGVVYLLGTANIFRNFSYIVPVFAFGIPFLWTKLVQKNQTLASAIDLLPNHWIVAVQLYRLLGILFILLYLEGLMPAEFAIPSGVGDIIIGITAPVVAYMYFKGHFYSTKLARAWNYLGILDLVIAMVMGPLTAPTIVQALSFDAPNELIISNPLSMVPTFAVPFSFILHLISLKILEKKRVFVK